MFRCVLKALLFTLLGWDGALQSGPGVRVSKTVAKPSRNTSFKMAYAAYACTCCLRFQRCVLWF